MDIFGELGGESGTELRCGKAQALASRLSRIDRGLVVRTMEVRPENIAEGQVKQRALELKGQGAWPRPLFDNACGIPTLLLRSGALAFAVEISETRWGGVEVSVAMEGPSGPELMDFRDAAQQLRRQGQSEALLMEAASEFLAADWAKLGALREKELLEKSAGQGSGARSPKL